MDVAQKMAMQFFIEIRILVVGTLLGLKWIIIAIMVEKKENLFNNVKVMDNGILTFPTVVIVYY